MAPRPADRHDWIDQDLGESSSARLRGPMRHASPAGLRARLQAPGAGQVSFLGGETDHDPTDLEPGAWNSTKAAMGWRLDATRHLSSAAAFFLGITDRRSRSCASQ